MTSPHLKAILFDIGGVVLRSPFIAIAEYERLHGAPPNYLNSSIAARGPQGAWQRFERGELALFPFYKAFGEDLSDTDNGNIWYREYCQRKGIDCPELPKKLNIDGRELFGLMMKGGGVFDEHILTAINKLRAARKWKIIALTNNFSALDKASPDPSDPGHIPRSEFEYLGWGDGGAAPPRLRALFDDFCDSSALGMRKPEPEFYVAACKRNGIAPKDAVFLDDIGINLKTAQKLGMETIHVPLGESLAAVKTLENKLGINLTSPSAPAIDIAKL